MASNLTNQEIRQREVIRLVCSQTNYTEEEAEQKLREKNNNYLEVIKDYMNPNRKPTQYTATVNQQIFKNIRNFLDSEQNNLDRRRDYYERARQMSCEKKIEQKITHTLTNETSTSSTTSVTNVPSKEELTKQNKTNIINI